jgi:hypothetical protein
MPQSSEPTRSDAPFANIEIVPYKAASSEVIQLGGVRLDILEDGRNTDQRIGALHITLQPHTKGPPEHWHQVGIVKQIPRFPIADATIRCTMKLFSS